MLRVNNMKYLIRFFVVFAFCVPFLASAQLPSLIVCDPVDPAKPCNFSSLITLANTIIEVLIILGTTVFSIMFMYAGFLYLTANGNTGQISKAHGLFWNTIIGFVIMLLAWALIDFILMVLVKGQNPDQYRLLSK
jgi:hypothetical protein